MKKESDLQGSNSGLEQRTNIPVGYSNIYSNILYLFGALVKAYDDFNDNGGGGKKFRKTQ